MMKKKMPNYMAYNLVHLILFRKCGYKIKFQSLSKKQTEDIVKPAMVEYKARLGLPRSTSTLAMQAMGLGDFWWETNVDRLLTMLKFLMGDDEMKAGLAMAGLYTEQMWGGGYCPVMETGFDVERGWSGTLWSRIWQCMSENNVQVKGGPVLGDRREHDFTLVDAVMHYGGTKEDKQLMRAACWGAEVWRMSEVHKEDGKLRFGLRPGQELHKAAGQVLKSKGKSARWIAVLELILSRAREEGSEQLGRWYRRAVSIGAVVVWWECTGWRAGEVRYMAMEQSWEDLVEVAPWVAVEDSEVQRRK